MRLLSFAHQGQSRIGSLFERNSVIDLNRAYAQYMLEEEKNPLGREIASILFPSDMTTFLKGGERAFEATRMAIEFVEDQISSRKGDASLREAGILLNRDELRLRAPVPRPGALLCAGKNFADHVGEMSGRGAPRFPVAFPKMQHTIIGPEDDVPYPREVKNLDYEVELAVVIGKPCRDVGRDEAWGYIAGYTVFNDISARDVVREENDLGVFLMGKNFPGFSPMGPYLVLREEIPDPQNLRLELRVNGEIRQKSDLSYMIFKIAEIISYWSQIGLKPGDILTTGTPSGVAAGKKDGSWWLQPGDVVEAEVESVGCLRNRIVPEE